MARILVVDDEEMDRVLNRTILENAGHYLLFAANGETALRMCRVEDVELVVTDLAMPDFNGLRFIRELRESARRKHKIPVLVLRKPGKKLTYAVVELSTFISLAKGAGWLDSEGEDAAESDTEQAAG